MKKLNDLHRKKYSIEIEIRRFYFWKTKIEIEFKQATLAEILHMMNWLNSDDSEDFLFEFLNKKGGITRKIFSKMTGETKVKILKFLVKNYTKGFFDDKKGVEKKEASPISSAICVILKQSNETLDSLLSLTWEQIEFIVEGISWNANELTKKGKRENIMKFAREEHEEEMSTEEALKRIKEKEKKGFFS